MLFVEVCVGSSCHLKGAPEIVELLQKNIAENHLEDDIVLAGSFCAGKCNRVGVTITVGDTIYTGITKEGFKDFGATRYCRRLKNQRRNSHVRLSYSQKVKLQKLLQMHPSLPCQIDKVFGQSGSYYQQ